MTSTDGTGTGPSTERCKDCGHPLDAWCDDFCCRWWRGDEPPPGLTRGDI